jgi:beta-glucosidase
MRHTAWWAAAAWLSLGCNAQDASPASISTDPIETILLELDILPSGLVDAAATVLAGVANTAQTAIYGTLENQTLSDERKLTDPEAYYSYGQSPPVYPSRES